MISTLLLMAIIALFRIYFNLLVHSNIWHPFFNIAMLIIRIILINHASVFFHCANHTHNRCLKHRDSTRINGIRKKLPIAAWKMRPSEGEAFWPRLPFGSDTSDMSDAYLGPVAHFIRYSNFTVWCTSHSSHMLFHLQLLRATKTYSGQQM